MEEKQARTYTLWDMAVYGASAVAVIAFMLHFWWPTTVVPYVLWGVSGFFAIFSIYGGIIGRSAITERGTRRGMATAAAVVGSLTLIGLAISAANLLVVVMLTFQGY